jgi:hypothetical protein
MDIGERLAHERRQRELSGESVRRWRDVWTSIVRDFFAMPQRPRPARVRMLSGAQRILPPSPKRVRARS